MEYNHSANTNESNPDDTSTHSPSGIVQQTNAIANNHATDNEKQKWYQKRPDWAHIFQAVGIVLGLAVAWIYFCQLQEMTTQTRLLNEQANRNVIEGIGNAKILGRQLNFLQEQTKAAQLSVNTTISQFRAGQRPWLGIEGGISIKKGGFPGRIQWTVATKIWNYGSSPATRVAVSFGPGPSDGNFRTHAAWKVSTTCKNSDSGFDNPQNPIGVAFPHTEFPQSYWRPYSTFNVPDGSYYVVVCITYTDSTTRIYHTKLLYSPDFNEFDMVDSEIK